MTLLKRRNLQWYHDSGLHFLNKGHWKKQLGQGLISLADHEQFCTLSLNSYHCLHITLLNSACQVISNHQHSCNQSITVLRTRDFFFNIICLLLWRQIFLFLFTIMKITLRFSGILPLKCTLWNQNLTCLAYFCEFCNESCLWSQRSPAF